MVLVVKNSSANADDIRDVGLIPGSERSPGGGHGNPLQCSCLENPLDMEPGRLQSIGSQRVRHDWNSLACTHMTNPESILKSRDITLWTKIHIVKAMVFLVVTYGYDSWSIKNAEHQKTDALELWCWRQLLRNPWLQRDQISQSQEINPEYSLEKLMLKLKF